MTALSSTRQNALILAVLLFGQLLLMAGSVRRAEGSTLLESWMIRLSSPVVIAVDFFGGGFRQIGSGIGNLIHAHSRNAELESELASLRTEVQLARRQQEENARLRQLLGMSEDLAPEGIAANVVSSVVTHETGMIVIDRGNARGVQIDAPVVAWGGAVGRVIAVSARHAKVQLLTDPNSGVGGTVQRNRAQGVVLGTGERFLDMDFLPRFSDVTHGDRVVTSGLDGIFPKGFGVGTVVRVTPRPDGSLAVQLERVLDFDELEVVLVLPRPVDEEALDSSIDGEEL